MAKWFCICLCIFGFAVFLPYLMQPIQGDAAIYTYIGQRMLQGDVPYRDAWDVKTPGIFFQMAGALWLLRGSEVGIFVLELLMALGTCMAVFVAARRLAGDIAGVFGGIAMFAGYTGFAYRGWGCQPETPAMLLSAAMCCVALGQGKLSTKESLFAGLAAGLLFWWKLPFVLFTLVLLPRIVHRDARAGLPRALLVGFLPFAAVCTAIIGYFWSKGALSDLWQGAFTMASRVESVYGLPLLTRLQWLIHAPASQNPSGGGLELLSNWAWPVLVLGIAGMASRLEGEAARAKSRVWLLFAVALIIIVWQGRYLEYHWLAVMPALAMFAGLGAAMASKWGAVVIPNASVRNVGLGIVMFLAGWESPLTLWRSLIAAGFDRTALWHSIPSNYGRNDLMPADAAPALARIIGARTSPSDTILGFDLDPQFNFYAQRKAPTRFSYLWPLTDARFADPLWSVEFAHSVLSAKPTYIVVCRANRRNQDIEVEPDGRRNVVAGDDLKVLRNWPALGPWFDKNYELAEQRGVLEAYKYTGP